MCRERLGHLLILDGLSSPLTFCPVSRLSDFLFFGPMAPLPSLSCEVFCLMSPVRRASTAQCYLISRSSLINTVIKIFIHEKEFLLIVNKLRPSSKSCWSPARPIDGVISYFQLSASHSKFPHYISILWVLFQTAVMPFCIIVDDLIILHLLLAKRPRSNDSYSKYIRY